MNFQWRHSVALSAHTYTNTHTHQYTLTTLQVSVKFEGYDSLMESVTTETIGGRR